MLIFRPIEVLKSVLKVLKKAGVGESHTMNQSQLLNIIICRRCQGQQEGTQMQSEWNKYLLKHKFRGVHSL